MEKTGDKFLLGIKQGFEYTYKCDYLRNDNPNLDEMLNMNIYSMFYLRGCPIKVKPNIKYLNKVLHQHVMLILDLLHLRIDSTSVWNFAGGT